MRGYGMTDRPAEIERYTLFHLVGDMVGVLDALGEKTAVIVGHDWGAPVAWHAALMRPDRFRAVVGLSVPYRPRGSIAPTTVMPQNAEASFYQLYFQAPGVAESGTRGGCARSRFARFCIRDRAMCRDAIPGAPSAGVGMVPRAGGFLTRMPSPETLPAWLTDADLDFYVQQFKHSGFRGGLNWYRNIDRNWELLAPYAGAAVTVPALYMAGDLDLVVSFPRMKEVIADLARYIPQLRGTIMLPGCGHWTQQERAGEVNQAMIEFLRGLVLAAHGMLQLRNIRFPEGRLMIQPSIPDQSDPTHQLSRSLKGRHLAMISIGGIIGAGLFVGSSTSIKAAGPAVFISYAITGMLILMVMRMLGEMATALPNVRSFTEFARSGLGDGAGFVVGWLYWYFWVLVVPVEAIAGAKILQLWMPSYTQLQIGLGLMTIMTGVNLMSARSYAEFEFWFASIKVAAILVFVVIAASFAFGWTAPAGATFGNLVNYGGFTPNGWIAVIGAAPTVFFAMTGAEITTVAAAESAQPGRAIAKMTTTVIWRILIFYVVSVFLIVSVVPWNTVRSGESPFTLALNTMHVPGASIDHERHHPHRCAVLLEFGLLCQFAGAVHPCWTRGDAPQALVKLNKRRVPVVSVLMGAAAGFLGIIAATEGAQKVFDFLLSSSGALMRVRLHDHGSRANCAAPATRTQWRGSSPPVSMWLFPYLSYATIACMGAVLIAMAFTPGQRQDFNSSCIT